MDIDDDQQFLQTAAIVLEDLECFITQKMNQNIIFAMLQIRKAVRRNRNSQAGSVDKRSHASLSQKNQQSRKSSISARSAVKSIGKQSHASFEIIRGAQTFNSTRRRGIQQKIKTEGTQRQKQYFSNRQQQSSRFSNPYPATFQQSARNNVVPKLVGLASSQQISDIDQPMGTEESRDKNKNHLRNYEQSIAQVDDDDDEFEDVVLSRLDKIEQKVNQMLRDKRQQKVSTITPRVPSGHHYHSSRSKLQNAVSGPNIILSNQPQNHQFYKYPETNRYNNSAALGSPRMYTFHNNVNTSSNQPLRPQYSKHHMTQRMSRIAKSSNVPNYMTDNEQYRKDSSRYPNKDLNSQFYQIQQISNEEIIMKNKKLGHYRDSSATFHQPEAVQKPVRPPHRIVRSNTNTVEESSSTKQHVIDASQAYKYIPFSKVASNKNQNLTEKTQRHISRRPQEYMGLNTKKIVQRSSVGSKQQDTFQQRFQPEHQKMHSGQFEGYRRSVVLNESKYRSGKDSGVRQKGLNGSHVKAYTEHGDFIHSGDDLSVSSEKNIYSEIRELRQITKMYGAEKQKKQTSLRQRQNPQQVEHNIQPIQYQNYDYRYHEKKTQRHKYPMSRNNIQQNNYQEQQEVIIQGQYPQERVVRVVKQISHYLPEAQMQMTFQGRMPQNIEYVQYEANQSVAYQQSHSHPESPIYMVKQRQDQGYQNGGQSFKQASYRAPTNKYHTVVINGDMNSGSNRKLSSASINSFKSIPHTKVQGGRNPSSKQYITKEKSIQYISERPAHYSQKGNSRKY